MELCLIDIKSVTKCTTGYLDLAFCVACMLGGEIIIILNMTWSLKDEILAKF